jgi:sugar fermentation stimulation protein A
MYLDCPSDRGRKHIKELSDYVKVGGEGILLLIAVLPHVKAFKPNKIS